MVVTIGVKLTFFSAFMVRFVKIKAITTMKKLSILFALFLCSFVLMLPIVGWGQTFKAPVNSPLQSIKQNFALGEIAIEYSRPSLRDRVAFGEIVPFDKLWRTGANACTKITFSDNVLLDGHLVMAGTYALFTIPGKKEWVVILNKNTKQSGTGSYKEEEDLLRFNVKPMPLLDKVETLTISIDAVRQTNALINISWDNTRIGFPVVANIDSIMMKNIESALSPEDKRPYFQAANYYFENNKDLGKALEWVNKAIDNNPKAFFMVHLKAKILMKQKDYAAAIAAAELSMQLAKDAKNDDYIQLNQKLIDEAKRFVKKG